VIGIIGPEFDLAEFGEVPELWVPFQLDPNTVDQGHFFQGRCAAQAERAAGTGSGEAEALLAMNIEPSFPRAAGQPELQRGAHSTSLRTATHADASDSERCGGLRPAHRVRERGKSPARARHGPEA